MSLRKKLILIIIIIAILLLIIVYYCGRSSLSRKKYPISEDIKNNNIVKIKMLAFFYPDLTFRTIEGVTPLHHSAQDGRYIISEFFIDKGVDVNARANLQNDTPLHRASYGGYAEIMKLLIDKGANVNAKDYSGQTPLSYAFKNENIKYETVKLLINEGADVNVNVGDNMKVIHIASFSGHQDILKLLSQNGADLNAVDPLNDDFTPLHFAVNEKNVEAVNILLKYGAKPNIQDSKGQTPLHHAILIEKHEIVKALLDYGADVNIKDEQGKTPLDLARERKNEKIVSLLQNKKRGK